MRVHATTIERMTDMKDLEILVTLYTVLLCCAFAQAIVNIFLFKRAGVAWWKAIIPFYGSFTHHKLAFGEEAKWFWFLNLAAPSVYGLYQNYAFARSFKRSVGFSILYLFFPVICGIVMLADGVEYDHPQEHFLV